MLSEIIKKRALELDTYVRETRGYLHTIPELAGEEFKTKEFLLNEIKQYNLEIEDVSTTGFIAIMDTGKPGKMLGLRADIDGLPIVENECNLKNKKKYISTNENSHACGHDTHMAMLLGAMKILYEIKDQLSGKILFLFEEGEERFSGIGGMMKALEKYPLDGVWGIHINATKECGTLDITGGAVQAGIYTVNFSVMGRGGHGSRPDLSINPVFAAASVLTNIAVAWPNTMDPDKPVTLGITTINGGKADNVFPDEVKITGTLRFFDKEAGDKAMKVLQNVAESTAAAHRCTIKYNTDYNGQMIPLVNDHEFSEFARVAAAEVLGEDAIIQGRKSYGSESFAMYTDRFVGAFGSLSAGSEENGTLSVHHTTRFDIEDSELVKGVMAHANIAAKFLSV